MISSERREDASGQNWRNTLASHKYLANYRRLCHSVPKSPLANKWPQSFSVSSWVLSTTNRLIKAWTGMYCRGEPECIRKSNRHCCFTSRSYDCSYRLCTVPWSANPEFKPNGEYSDYVSRKLDIDAGLGKKYSNWCQHISIARSPV